MKRVGKPDREIHIPGLMSGEGKRNAAKCHCALLVAPRDRFTAPIATATSCSLQSYSDVSFLYDTIAEATGGSPRIGRIARRVAFLRLASIRLMLRKLYNPN